LRRYKNIYLYLRFSNDIIKIRLTTSTISQQTLNNLINDNKVYIKGFSAYFLKCYLTDADLGEIRDYFDYQYREVNQILVPSPYYVIDVQYTDQAADKTLAADGSYYNVTRLGKNFVNFYKEYEPEDYFFSMLNAPQPLSLIQTGVPSGGLVFQSGSISKPVLKDITPLLVSNNQFNLCCDNLERIFLANFIRMYGSNIALTIQYASGISYNFNCDNGYLNMYFLPSISDPPGSFLTGTEYYTLSADPLTDPSGSGVAAYLVINPIRIGEKVQLAAIWGYNSNPYKYPNSLFPDAPGEDQYYLNYQQAPVYHSSSVMENLYFNQITQQKKRIKEKPFRNKIPVGVFTPFASTPTSPPTTSFINYACSNLYYPIDVDAGGNISFIGNTYIYNNFIDTSTFVIRAFWTDSTGSSAPSVGRPVVRFSGNTLATRTMSSPRGYVARYDPSGPNNILVESIFYTNVSGQIIYTDQNGTIKGFQNFTMPPNVAQFITLQSTRLVNNVWYYFINIYFTNITDLALFLGDTTDYVVLYVIPNYQMISYDYYYYQVERVLSGESFQTLIAAFNDNPITSDEINITLNPAYIGSDYKYHLLFNFYAVDWNNYFDLDVWQMIDLFTDGVSPYNYLTQFAISQISSSPIQTVVWIQTSNPPLGSTDLFTDLSITYNPSYQTYSTDPTAFIRLRGDAIELDPFYYEVIERDIFQFEFPNLIIPNNTTGTINYIYTIPFPIRCWYVSSNVQNSLLSTDMTDGQQVLLGHANSEPNPLCLNIYSVSNNIYSLPVGTYFYFDLTDSMSNLMPYYEICILSGGVFPASVVQIVRQPVSVPYYNSTTSLQYIIFNMFFINTLNHKAIAQTWVLNQTINPNGTQYTDLKPGYTFNIVFNIGLTPPEGLVIGTNTYTLYTQDNTHFHFNVRYPIPISIYNRTRRKYFKHLGGAVKIANFPGYAPTTLSCNLANNSQYYVGESEFFPIWVSNTLSEQTIVSRYRDDAQPTIEFTIPRFNTVAMTGKNTILFKLLIALYYSD
jgi:hypothetical protein